MAALRARSLPVLGLLAFASACGKAPTTPPTVPPFSGGPTVAASASAADEGAANPQAATVPDDGGADLVAGPEEAGLSPGHAVGFLEGAARLQHLFEALARLEGGNTGDDVRILQYGDSHTASDLGVSVFRRALQARFGDGGRGFVPLGKPWKFFSEDGVRGAMSDFKPARVVFHKKGATFTGTDGSYGLLGIGIAASKAGAEASTEVSASTSRVEVDYLRQPHGGSFDVFVDGARVGKVDTSAPASGEGFASFDTSDGPHKVEVKTLDDGEVRIFGMVLDRAQAGVVVDTLGINGAQIFTPLRWNEDRFAEQLRHRSPDLVIFAYGTNEALEPGLKDAEYEAKLVSMLGRAGRAVPAASCLLLGPPDLARHTKGQDDWKTWPRVLEIAAVQRRVAQAAGCAFYDQVAAMGGPGSMASWAAEADPRGSHDRIHLMKSGYAQLATTFAGDLMRAYNAWNLQRKTTVTR